MPTLSEQAANHIDFTEQNIILIKHSLKTDINNFEKYPIIQGNPFRNTVKLRITMTLLTLIIYQP